MGAPEPRGSAPSRPGRFGYFGRPLPSRAGFSPYRSPGLVVHLPVWGGTTVLGLALWLPHGYLGWAALLWLIGGLYLGRDLAIVAHYFPPLSLILLGAVAGLWVNADSLFRWGEGHGPWLAIGLTAALAALLARNGIRFSRPGD